MSDHAALAAGLAETASSAKMAVNSSSGEIRNRALARLASLLERNRGRIIAANRIDLRNAAKAGLSPAMLDRLTMTRDRIGAMAQGVREVAALPDPV